MFKSKPKSDKKLIKGCLESDVRCQEQLYKKYFDSMFAMCLSYTADKEVALIIVNTGMMRVFQKMDKYSFKGSFEGWIRKIVFHSLSEYFKKENRYRSHIVLEEKDKSENHGIIEALYYEDLIQLLDFVPAASARVFNLYIFEGNSHKEIAAELGISEGTSKWHLNNARKRLQELIKSRERSSYVG